MTIAADPRFRSIRLAFDNNDTRGNELVQLFARLLGGDWALVRTFAVAGSEQVTSWDTALPVAFYDLAERYVSGNVPAVGYEGSPDEWTAPTASASKTTVTSSSAVVAWSGGVFVDAGTPINLQWTSAQQNVPYLLEKNVGAGFVTVAADLIATNYSYAIPPAELGTTVTFRVTAQRAAIVGPSAGTLDVPMFVTVGQPAWVSATFDSVARSVALQWSIASQAVTYLLEKNLGSGWVTIGTVSATNYNYAVPDAEINTTVNFRVTGQNGATSGTPSLQQPVAMTVTVAQPVLSVPTFNPVTGIVGLMWTAALGAMNYFVEYFNGVSWVNAGTTSVTNLNVSATTAQINTTVPWRVTGFNSPVVGTPSAPQNIAETVTLVAPGTPAVSYTGSGSSTLAALTWTAAAGDVYQQSVQVFRSGLGGWVTQGNYGASAASAFFNRATYPDATSVRVVGLAAGGALVAISPTTPVVWP